VKKSVLLSLCLVLALALSGVAYAAWSGRLYIESRVYLGTLKMQCTAASANGGGEGVTVVSSQDSSTGDPSLSITNLYPGAGTIAWTLTYSNTGTIPATVTGIELDFDGDHGELVVEVDGVPLAEYNAALQASPVSVAVEGAFEPVVTIDLPFSAEGSMNLDASCTATLVYGQ